MQILDRYQWLQHHAYGWQFGETGILRALCVRFGINKGFEIGAGDGETLPVTLSFLPNLTLYEIELERQEKLRVKYPDAVIRGSYEVPDASMGGNCVVIDVDSFDLNIAKTIIETCKPKVLCVEHYDLEGPKVNGIETDTEVPDWLLGVMTEHEFTIQQPWQVVQRTLAAKGYTLVALTRVNGIYVYENC
jgi:hypothetical protein